MRNHLVIYVNGRRHEVRGRGAFQSLSDFLRHDLGLIGTKVVCAEGDCGSCTVFVARLQDDKLVYRTVTSCIQFLYQLDCTHVVTIEGLKYDGRLNPVQEAIVKCQGAQCGFCTPGIVVSMCALFEKTRDVETSDVKAALVGNLCRCTGYDSIVKSGLEVDADSLRKLDDLYPPHTIVPELLGHAGESVRIVDQKTFFKPVTIDEAVRFRAENADCMIIAGGTDVGVQMNKCLRDPQSILSLAGMSALRGVEVKDNAIVAGANATIAEMETFTRDVLPEYSRLLYYFGSPPIKNAATIGGNIGNGSPIADSIPAIYAMNGEVELVGLAGPRRVNIHDYYTGYKKTVQKTDELIARLVIPLPLAGETLKLYKISRRKDLDISAFTAAIWMRQAGSAIDDIRIVYGGVGPNILRLRQTEHSLRGQGFTLSTLRRAGKIARSEIRPISDVRGSADYRLQLGENILAKFFVDVSGTPSGNGNGWNNGNGDGNGNGRSHDPALSGLSGEVH
ncbi:MAG TPA: FAD binding domain-containing protein [Tepidisphaeraceae bacterium]|jgi:xanthine dehydrogenase small subunit|nr:FAD binding domain-containing protein [Tepidisphaeraceae bacterium]